MRDFDFTLSGAGATFRLNASGRYFRYMLGSAGSGSTRLTVRGLDTGTQVSLVPGQAVRLPAAERTWLLSSPTGASIIGTVLVGDGMIDDASVAGVVEVIDGGRARAVTNIAYSAYGYRAAGGAGQYSVVALWNASSTQRFVVERIVALAGATTIGAQLYSLASVSGFTTSSNGIPKVRNGLASVSGSVRHNVTGALPADTLIRMGFSVQGGTSLSLPMNPVSPFIVTPASGLAVIATIANADLGASFEWYEEANV